jgi:hypothetical protein
VLDYLSYMKQLIAAATALGFATLVAGGCSGSSFTAASGGATGSSGSAGTSSTGESGSGTSGGSASGGSDAAGGDATGGTDSGGAVSGGTGGGISTGGISTGGISTGGASSGGGGTGGGGTGGSISAGGTSGDGACNADTDCTDCAYRTAPKMQLDCYCANCATTPMSKSECAANQADYAKVCGDVPLVCPAAACIMPPKPVCKSHKCVAS